MSLVQFSHSVVSDSLRPHEPQHTRPPCPSLTPRIHPNPCPLSRWCHPAISPSVVPFSSCPQSFPASGSFQMSQFFASGGQSIGDSALASVLLMNIQDWFPFRMDWFDLLAVKNIHSLTIIPRDFNIPFSTIHKTTRQTIKKIEDLDNTTISN